MSDTMMGWCCSWYKKWVGWWIGRCSCKKMVNLSDFFTYIPHSTVYITLSIYLSVHLPIYLSIFHLSKKQFIYIPTFLPTYLSIYQSKSIKINQSIYLSLSSTSVPPLPPQLMELLNYSENHTNYQTKGDRSKGVICLSIIRSSNEPEAGRNTSSRANRRISHSKGDFWG